MTITSVILRDEAEALGLCCWSHATLFRNVSCHGLHIIVTENLYPLHIDSRTPVAETLLVGMTYTDARYSTLLCLLKPQTYDRLSHYDTKTRQFHMYRLSVWIKGQQP